MSQDKVVQNMMNLAKHSSLIPEGKEEMFRTFVRIVYQAARFDGLIEKAQNPRIIPKTMIDKIGKNVEPRCTCAAGLGIASNCPIHSTKLKKGEN